MIQPALTRSLYLGLTAISTTCHYSPSKTTAFHENIEYSKLEMKRSPLLVWTVLLCLYFAIAFFLYLPSLDAPMYYDSEAQYFLENESVFANQGILRVISLFPQRPIPMMTFYFNYSDERYGHGIFQNC